VSSLVLTAALPTVTSLNQEKCIRAYLGLCGCISVNCCLSYAYVQGTIHAVQYVFKQCTYSVTFFTLSKENWHDEESITSSVDGSRKLNLDVSPLRSTTKIPLHDSGSRFFGWSRITTSSCGGGGAEALFYFLFIAFQLYVACYLFMFHYILGGFLHEMPAWFNTYKVFPRRIHDLAQKIPYT
jgi:hypothetical protein